jgi:hypothetical protein
VLYGKDSTHQSHPQEESREAMQEDISQGGTTGRVQIASESGAPKETDTSVNQRLSMVGVGEGPIGVCIEGEPEGRDNLKGCRGKPGLE